jgi:O-antigen ligase
MKLNCQNIFIFLFLAVYPFGQIIRIGIIQPIDLIVGLAAFYTIVKRLKSPISIKYFGLFVLFASFSWIYSFFIFHQFELMYGLLYLFRLAGYYFFGIYVWNFIRKSQMNKKLLITGLMGVSTVSAIFGWIQYFMFPDLKAFFIYGWDMHLFRIFGTFLDPTFLSLIIVFGLLLSIYLWIDKWNWKYFFITAFLLISLAFTYSRAGYLAFAAGVGVIIYFKRRFKNLMFLIGGLAILALLLPTSKNNSIELFRTFSAVARIDNYKTTLQIFSKSPIFGVGYNNMCIAYQKYIGVQPFSSHACSGSDSSLLLVLATTGITGFIVFVFSIAKIIKSLQHNSYFIILSSSFFALLVHSLFSNSMFYSWIMGYFIILLATASKE